MFVGDHVDLKGYLMGEFVFEVSITAVVRVRPRQKLMRGRL
jgi:hypothetical protein